MLLGAVHEALTRGVPALRDLVVGVIERDEPQVRSPHPVVLHDGVSLLVVEHDLVGAGPIGPPAQTSDTEHRRVVRPARVLTAIDRAQEGTAEGIVLPAGEWNP